MKTPRSKGATSARNPSQPDDWQRWSTELPATTLVLLKVRAAQEQRPMREVLDAAIVAYLKTAVPA